MPVRQKAHGEEEKAIFEAFLAAFPSFAKTVTEFRQPDAEFPDVIVTLNVGGEVDFELVEWLHGEMARAKARERLTRSIEDANLLNAAEPGFEAFEIYPAWLRCR